jgi:hypothetical protein
LLNVATHCYIANVTVTRIPDEVWHRLDPGAGRLSRRTAIRLWAAIAAALALLVAATVVWWTGLVAPRLVWSEGPSQWSTTVDGVVHVEFDMINVGRFPVTVLGVGRSGPGLQFLGIATGPDETDAPQAVGPFPVTLQADNGIAVWLVYRITSCAAMPAGSWPVTAVVQRPWGTMTVDVPEGRLYGPWQTQIAHPWCGQR